MQPIVNLQLVAPFEWRGGKRRVAPQVWPRFGRVGHYIEPFLGGGAVLLARPNPAGMETVNDLDGLLVNFWRSLKMRPDEVIHHVRFPPSDLDLRVRHTWLRAKRAEVDAGLEDPAWCDPLAAAWWCWGQAHAYHQRWVERPSRPLLDPMPVGPNRLDGAELLAGLARRLQRVTLLRRDWASVLRPSIMFRNRASVVGVFLDPPYEGDEGWYAARASVAGAVWDWARENGEDGRLRIAVCGYDDGRATPRGWSVLPWSSQGGGARRHEERIWFSPTCLPA
jgi:DNA adenine methylase